MSSEHDDNPEGFVTRQECAQISSGIKEELKTIRVAIVGENMQGGLVQKVGKLENAVEALKKERSTVIELIKSVGVPIAVAVITAVIISRL